MNKYGECAVIAVELINSNQQDPVKAWAIAVQRVFPDKEAARKKCCPKNAFLGLCEEGAVKGVKKGNYTKSLDNKAYALKAIQLLKSKSALNEDRNKLWSAVISNSDKKHNSQMDVVLALWNNKLIA